MTTEREDESKRRRREVELKRRQDIFGRATRYCVIPHDTLAAFNLRPQEELVKVQGLVDDEMLNALEAMVKAARAGTLEGEAALALEACAW